MKLRISIPGVLFLLSCAALADDVESVVLPDGTRLPSKEVRFPVSHSSGHLAVQVEVNGTGPYRFQLDTGAGLQACVDVGLAKQLGLNKVGQVQNSAGDPKNAVVRDLVRIDELSVGAVKFRNVNALSADYRWIQGEGEQRVWGLLGFDLFKHLLLTIDYPQNQIALSVGELSKRDPHVIRFNVKDKTPRVSLKIGEMSIDAMIDTGSQAALAVPDTTAKTLTMASAPVETGRARTVNEEFPIYQGVLRDDVILGVYRHPGLKVSIFEPHQFSLIGYGLVRDKVLCFDQRNKLLRVARP